MPREREKEATSPTYVNKRCRTLFSQAGEKARWRETGRLGEREREREREQASERASERERGGGEGEKVNAAESQSKSTTHVPRSCLAWAETNGKIYRRPNVDG